MWKRNVASAIRNFVTHLKDLPAQDVLMASTTVTLAAAGCLLWGVAMTSQHSHVVNEKSKQFPYDTNSVVCEGATMHARKLSAVRRRATIRIMKESSSKAPLASRYDVEWTQPLGVGAFGAVYLASDRQTKRKVALKKISKKHTTNDSFNREMEALLHLQNAAGTGHPNICSLIEHFDEGDYFYLILDLVSGGELFDHLVEQGAYSEMDASRLIREIASALAFLHGLGTTHGDLKPENLMLSTRNSTDAVIQIVDFGCAYVDRSDGTEDDGAVPSSGGIGKTLAYCPPEQLRKGSQMHPSMDIWALGVILYIMLTGVHPFDLNGDAPDEEVAKIVLSHKPPPLRGSPLTVHLSDSAIDLMERCMTHDPSKRITAIEMLDHPWVKGETARETAIADIDKKLSLYRPFKTRMEQKVFAEFVEWSDEETEENARRTSLIERSFRAFDPSKKGYITKEDMQKAMTGKETLIVGKSEEGVVPVASWDSAHLSLSGFSDMLAENMKNKYFPKGHVVYREGDVGNHMYFINSGAVLVQTGGISVKRGPGDFFGEGALLNPQRVRSATIRCATPVHALEISRDFFEKNLASSDPALLMTLREKDKIRKRNRAKLLLGMHENLIPLTVKNGEIIFDKDQVGDCLFIVESGKVNILMGDKLVLAATPGNMFGESSVVLGKKRNVTAVCAALEGCQLKRLMKHDFTKLVELSPEILDSVRDLCLRREFKKAVVHRLQKEFPYDNPREAFDSVSDKTNCISREAVQRLLREMDPDFTDEEIREMIYRLDLTKSGSISFDEFKKVFIAHIKKSASI